VNSSERNAWEQAAKDAARKLVWAEANLMGKTLLPMTKHLDLADLRREARSEVDRLDSIGRHGIPHDSHKHQPK
jgi:hypothetical protein